MSDLLFDDSSVAHVAEDSITSHVIALISLS